MLRTVSGDGSFVTPLANVDIAKLKARIPVEQNPYVLNPERGFCCSANQNPVDQTYPYLTNGVYENYRNRVINTTLTTAANYTWQDMGKLQNNNLSLLAKEILPTLLANVSTDGNADAEKFTRCFVAGIIMPTITLQLRVISINSGIMWNKPLLTKWMEHLLLSVYLNPTTPLI